MERTAPPSDEELMAFADDMLDAPDRARIEAALAADPGLADRLALFTRTGDALRLAASARPLPPVPAALEAAVRGQIAAARAAESAAPNVVPLMPRAARAPWLRPAAVAACLALAVGLASGYGLSLRPGAMAQGDGFLDLDALAGSLSTLPSGQAADLGAGRLVAIATFRDANGTLCREFELDDAGGSIVSVACHDGAAWHTAFAIAVAADTPGYAPASSLETLEAWMRATGAGSPFDPATEAATLAAIAPKG